MYDVMLIDDDLTVRQRLRAMIDWKALGLRVVCEAADSDSAMELYLLHRWEEESCQTNPSSPPDWCCGKP